MRKAIFIIGLCLLAGRAAALECDTGTCSFEGIPINNHILQTELKALGYPSWNIGCEKNKCTIHWNAGVVVRAADRVKIQNAIDNHKYIDHRQQAVDRKKAAKILAGKLKNGTATQAEKDALLLYLLRQFGLGE